MGNSAEEWKIFQEKKHQGEMEVLKNKIGQNFGDLKALQDVFSAMSGDSKDTHSSPELPNS